MEFTADQVWGLAVAADRINGGYFKEDEWNTNSAAHFVSKQANKKMVKQWLRDGAFSEATEQDIEQGREYRRYFNTFTLKVLMGKITDFERQALRIAQMDEFTGRNLLEFSIISCLPSVARKDQKQTDLKRELYASTQLLGNIGDQITGSITVISSRHNPNYDKFRIQARIGEAFIDFWHKEALEGDYTVKGKIKAVRDDKTTQLNYVKVFR
jgi:hypothetical protein